MKIIIAGIHNKESFAPLDSSTHTGKIIDAIIDGVNGLSFIKSNVFKECIPNKYYWYKEVFDWEQRVAYKKGDIVIALGNDASKALNERKIPHIKLKHPGCVWSHENKTNYIIEAITKIKEQYEKHL